LRNAVRLEGVWRNGDRQAPVKLALDPEGAGSSPPRKP
jgi:hypothetical protein